MWVKVIHEKKKKSYLSPNHKEKEEQNEIFLYQKIRGRMAYK